LFHLRKALKTPNKLPWSAAILNHYAQSELAWWTSQLANAKENGVPLASRFMFPTSSETTICHYGDASREIDNVESSGAGAWSVVDDVFVFIEWRWTNDDLRKFSINVLETIIKDVATRVFIGYARSQGLPATHSLAFTDNSTAEHVAERGRASTEALNVLNIERQQWLVDNNVSQRSERVASVDNDVADLLSRGDLGEALRFPRHHGLPVQRLHVDRSQYDPSRLQPTWV
jgi:hypothetical protein